MRQRYNNNSYEGGHAHIDVLSIRCDVRVDTLRCACRCAAPCMPIARVLRVDTLRYACRYVAICCRYVAMCDESICRNAHVDESRCACRYVAMKPIRRDVRVDMSR